MEGHSLASFIRHDAKVAVLEALGNGDKTHKVSASPGITRWADTPWIAVMNPIVTVSPQAGYYVAYLYGRGFSTVVLSMQIGITVIRRRFGSGPKARAEFAAATEHLRRIASQWNVTFPVADISLGAVDPGTRTAFYEVAHAFGKVYSLQDLPSDEALTSDLRSMVSIYDSIAEMADPVIEAKTAPDFDIQLEGNLDTPDWEDTRRRRLHSRIERNARLIIRAKSLLGTICQVCGFDFASFYGQELGADFIEAHHRVPLSELIPGARVHLDPRKDFAVLCANCHRMMHRRHAPESVEALKEIVCRIRRAVPQP